MPPIHFICSFIKKSTAPVFLLALLLPFAAFAQNDSLKNLIRTAPHDSVRMRMCNDFAARLANSDVKSAIYFSSEALRYSKVCKNKHAEALALITLGYSNFYGGNGDTAIVLYNQAIVLARQVSDCTLVAMAFNRTAYVHRERGELTDALKTYNQALKSNKNEANASEAGFTYLNIGLIYHDKGDLDNALKNEEKGLALYRKSGEEVKIANALARIGNVWVEKFDTAKALDYYKQSMELFERNGHLRGVGICLNNMAMIYDGKGDYRTELKMYFRAAALRLQIGDKNGVAVVYNNVGGVYEKMRKFDSALYYLQKSMDIAKELDFKDMLSDNYSSISSTYELMGDYERALAYYKLFHSINDSIFGDKNRQELNELNTKFETASREKQIKALTTEGELKAVALDSEKKKNWLMIAAVALLILFIVFVWRSAIRSRRANTVLERQKMEIAAQAKIVEEQHHDILDSITYAKRIQNAVLPTEEERLKLFPRSFVFYRPRDIVSGDFYWMSTIGGMKIIAVGDCTGHGVPGAFMSLIGNTLLNEIVNEKKVTDPGIILNQLSVAIGHVLKQKESDNPVDVFSSGNVKDGMDISMCAIDEQSGMLFFAGANNPLMYTSKGTIFELKGDRQPIGFFEADKKPFHVHTVPLKEIECFYLFSDGYADQFGGNDGKKFKQSRLKEELHRISGMQIDKQGAELTKVFDDWRGNLEQVDDVCVLGVVI